MRCQGTKLLMLASASVWFVAVGPPAGGVAPCGPCFVDYTWVAPCVAQGECGGASQQGPMSGLDCWCEDDWDGNAAWDWEASPGCCGPPPECPCYYAPDYPQKTFHNALIEETNTGTCPRSGAPCATDDDCGPLWQCANLRHYLKINLIDEAIGDMTVKTSAEGGNVATLTVRFESKELCVGGGNEGEPCVDDSDCQPGGTCNTAGKTLTVATVTIDGQNGPAAIEVEDNATLMTDTTD